MRASTLAQAITVIGIELRTTNLQAMQTIPPLWQRFAQEGVLAAIPQRLNDDVSPSTNTTAPMVTLPSPSV